MTDLVNEPEETEGEESERRDDRGDDGVGDSCRREKSIAENDSNKRRLTNNGQKSHVREESTELDGSHGVLDSEDGSRSRSEQVELDVVDNERDDLQ